MTSMLRSGFSAAMARPLAALVGIVVGVALAPGGGFDWAWSIYDDWRPVVRMSGKVVSKDGESVLIEIGGDKLRRCAYLGVRAYAERGGQLFDANIERRDKPADGHTKPLGTFSIGHWRVWPVDAADRVMVMVQHSCDGRLVTTRIADVSLK